MWTFTIDGFATKENTKTERFNSKFWGPKTEAVDAISQNWSNEHNWLVPPNYLIPKTLRHFLSCDKGTKAILICPYWPLIN